MIGEVSLLKVARTGMVRAFLRVCGKIRTKKFENFFGNGRRKKKKTNLYVNK